MGSLLTRHVLHFAVWLGAMVMAGCGGGDDSGSPLAVPPTITSQPAAATVTAGQVATFNVTASGTAPLSYQWRRAGVEVTGAGGASYTTPATAIGDNGALFSVVVTNAAGSVASADATLTVNLAPTAPSIATQPAGISVVAGATATFTVAATGAAPLTYQWRLNGVNIAGASAAIYATPGTTVGDDGAVFSVVVSNAVGNVTSSDAVLKVTANAPTPLARYIPVWSSNDTTSSTGSYTLSVVDPAAPGTLIAVDQVPTITGNLGTILRLRGGVYNAASGLVGDPGVRNLVYVKGGSLYRVNLDKGGGPPAPVRLSTESLATGLLQIAAASATGADALISYFPTSGAARYVGLSAAAGTAPRTTPNYPGDLLTSGLIGWANDPATGDIATLYWRSLLPSGASRLFRTDASFGNPTSVGTFSSTIDTLWVGIGGASSGGRMRHGTFFIADGALRRLDFASGSVRVVLGGVTNTFGGAVFDDSHMYQVLQSASGAQLVRAADDDSTPGQVIASGAALTGFSAISAQTRDYLLFVTGATGDTAVSIRKTDGLLTPLPAASPPMGLTASWTTSASLFSGTAGNRVFYHYPGRIGSVAADGSDRREHSGYYMSTAMVPASLPAHRLHVWEPFTLPAARLLVQSGSSLTWLDAASGDLGVTVGSAPGIATFGNEQPPYKDWALGRAGAIGYQANVLVSPGTIVGRLDAIYLTDQANSLLRLTNVIP